MTLQTTETCPTCQGTGIKDERPCPTCRGNGLVYRPKTIEVNIPKGAREGSVIKLGGQGQPGLGNAPAGDLFLKIHLEPHSRFTVGAEGDVQMELPVSPWEAVLGAKITIPLLDGPVEVTIPPGSQGGQKLRLRGQGMNLRRGGRADAFVRLKLVVPKPATDEERELFERLSTASTFDPRASTTGGRG